MGYASNILEGCMRSHLRSMILLVALPLLSGVVALFAMPTPAHAAQTVPYKMNFQGRLTNASGVALSGSYDVEIRLYSAASGGTFLWGESRTAANSNAATVTNGLFSVLIGDSVDTPANATIIAGGAPGTLQGAITSSQNVFLEVKVGTEILSTRSRIASSAFSINSDMLDGLDSSAFAPASGSTAYAPITGSTNYAPTSGSTNYIQNGSSQQATSNFNISGNGTIGGVGTVTGNFTNNGAALFSNTANSASAFTIQGMSSVKLFVADTSASRIYIGDPTPNATGIVLVLDNSTAEPAGTDGAMYYNTTTKSFRCYKNGLWADCNFASLRSEWAFQEDFTGGLATTGNIGDQSWVSTAVGSGAVSYTSVGAVAQNQDRLGVLQFASTVTNPSGISIRQNTGSMAGVPANMTVEFDFGPVNAAAAAGLQQIHRIGLHNSTGAAAASTGMYFQYVATTAAGNWFRCTQATCIDTGVARTTTIGVYQRFKIQTNTTGTSVEFFINEASVGTVTTNLPTVTSAYTPAYNTSGTDVTIRQWKTDYFQIKRNLTTLR